MLANQLPDSGYISTRLRTIYNVLCASPRYLKRKGSPASPEELQEHDCLLMSSVAFPDVKWLFEGVEGQSIASLNPRLFRSIRSTRSESLSEVVWG
ncbi:hypothetical protein [Pseudomonas sp. ICMP 561]|uniref:hypothetical protein n=1 Tax=Pseudomonas sp. ICMP 561 TaxID=1718918 RepID=UPI00359CB32F